MIMITAIIPTTMLKILSAVPSRELAFFSAVGSHVEESALNTTPPQADPLAPSNKAACAVPPKMTGIITDNEMIASKILFIVLLKFIEHKGYQHLGREGDNQTN